MQDCWTGSSRLGLGLAVWDVALSAETCCPTASGDGTWTGIWVLGFRV